MMNLIRYSKHVLNKCTYEERTERQQIKINILDYLK